MKLIILKTQLILNPSNYNWFFVIFGILILHCTAIFAQMGTNYQIQSWTTDEGLPQNTVRSILQTPDGYLWMTTLDGLVRFDGVHFEIFNKQNTADFGTNRLFDLVRSPDGDLWIETESDFVIQYHDGKFKTHTPGSQSAISNRMRNLFLDNQGNPVVFSDLGMFVWNGTAFINYQPFAEENNRSFVLWSKTGAFWYSRKNILHRLKDGKTVDFSLPGDEIVNNIVKIFEDRLGRLWIGTHLGLFVVENDKLKSYTTSDGLPSNDAKPVMEDLAGNVWIVTIEGAAVIAPDGTINTITTGQGLSDNFTGSVFQDREGSIWIGTFHRGLNRLTTRSIQFYGTKEGLAAPVINPIYQLPNNDILIGGGGLTLYHNNQFNLLSIPATEKLIPNIATAITADHTGRIWFAHWEGVFYYENGKFTDFTSRLGLKPTIVDIHEDAEGNIWFASNAGVFRYQNDNVSRFTKDQNLLISDDVKVIHESLDGTKWFGTYGGLSKLKDGIFTSYTTVDGLSSNQIRSLYEDSDGVLWIGSYDGGLTRFKDGKFTRYMVSDGLFNDGVFQILEDNSNNFWMSCNRGIYRVAKQQLNDFANGKINRIESIAYGKTDGLLETECNGGQQPAGAKMRDGKLWFPTQSGVAVIDPEKIQKNMFAPPIVIETAKIDGEIIRLNDEIILEPDKNNLEINYTGLSFIKPEFVKFRYKLEGLDSKWIEAGNRRTAYYSYLPPGNYNFAVIASNSDGVWNETGASINIKVIPRFYRTWWFVSLILILVTGLVISLYHWRVKRLETARRLQENFSRQLIESQESERQRIAAELHDGLGQSLLVIKNRALLGTMSPDDQPEAQLQFKEISSASSQALEEVREIAYNLRPYHLDRLGLTQSIKAMLETVRDSTGVEFAFDIMPLEGLFPKNEEVIVYRIIQESINNIIKHSGASEANILIHRSSGGLTITIEDNGCGFTPNLQNRTGSGFGLIGIEERVRILGGTLQIRTEPDNGTTIIIRELAKNNG